MIYALRLLYDPENDRLTETKAMGQETIWFLLLIRIQLQKFFSIIEIYP